MITVIIDDYKHPADPYMCSIKRPNVDVFLEGFKQLCNKTGMHKVDINGLKVTGPIPTVLNFDDGTSVGVLRMFQEIGFDFDNNNK